MLNFINAIPELESNPNNGKFTMLRIIPKEHLFARTGCSPRRRNYCPLGWRGKKIVL